MPVAHDFSVDAKEAMSIVDEIFDLIGSVAQWTLHEGSQLLLELAQQWSQLCQENSDAGSPAFVRQAEALLEKFAPLQRDIVQKNQAVADGCNDRIDAIQALVDDEQKKVVLEFLDQAVAHWNKTVKPCLDKLLNESIALQERIWALLDWALEIRLEQPSLD